MKTVHKLVAATLTATLFAISPTSAQDTLRIGAPLPITGALAPEGAKLKQGYELWQKKVNAAGGIKAGDKKLKVELVYYDYQSTTVTRSAGISAGPASPIQVSDSTFGSPTSANSPPADAA